MSYRRSTISALTLVAFSLVLSLPAAAKRPITFDDMISLGRVSDPQVSPDDKWVAYVVDY